MVFSSFKVKNLLITITKHIPFTMTCSRAIIFCLFKTPSLNCPISPICYNQPNSKHSPQPVLPSPLTIICHSHSQSHVVVLLLRAIQSLFFRNRKCNHTDSLTSAPTVNVTIHSFLVLYRLNHCIGP